MNLQSTTLLAKLQISQWYNRATDKRVTKEVAERYQLEQNEDSYVKKLLPTVALKKISSCVLDLRQYHNSATLPWSDGSVRILQSAKFFEYRQKMQQLISNFDAEVNAFLLQYPNWVSLAAQNKKGLFDSSQYPSTDEIRRAFSASVSFMPFPDVSDFRTSLPTEILNQMKHDAQLNLAETLRAANEHLINRLIARLETLHDAVVVPNKIFRDATVYAVVETAELVSGLNITNDADVNRAVSVCNDLMAVVTPEGLRTLPEFRANFAARLANTITTLKERSS